MDDRRTLIPPHGGYHNLRSFRCAQQVYDATVIFCDRFVEKRSRTHDQMVQAARSGVQNIAEGSMETCLWSLVSGFWFLVLVPRTRDQGPETRDQGPETHAADRAVSRLSEFGVEDAAPVWLD